MYVNVQGYLVADATIHEFGDDNAVATLRLADNEGTRQDTDKPMWVTLKVWGKAARYAVNNGLKGNFVVARGTLNYDKQTGNPLTYVRDDGSLGISNFEVNTQGGSIQIVSRTPATVEEAAEEAVIF